MFIEFKNEDFGKFVTTGLNDHRDKQALVGRLVQVRKRAGAFGSDCVLLRHLDGRLIVHENQFFTIIDDYLLCHWLEFIFKDVVGDSPEEEYTLGEGRRPKTGFIIDDDECDRDSSCSFAITIQKCQEDSK